MFRTLSRLRGRIVRSGIALAALAAAIGVGFVLVAGATAAGATCDGLAATIVGTAGDDNLVGTSGADVIAGLGGNDTIDGGGGNDVICGGPGNDTIQGGAGTDRVSFAEATAAVVASLAAGTATGDGTDTLAGVEDLTGGPKADTLTGDAGANTLRGGGGNDVLSGGSGNDVLDGGAGIDTVSFGSAGAAVNANLATGTATGDGTDTLQNDESLSGSANGDTLTGDGNANVIDGGAGNDVLDGGGGSDTVSFASATAAVTASLAAGTATGAGSDTLSGFESVLGGPKSDNLTGDDNANAIDGGAGTDTCHLKNGLDTGANCEIVDGAIESSGATDTYTFKGGTGKTYFVDSQTTAPTTCSSLTWTLTGPGGTIFGPGSVCSDHGPIATPAGTYTLTITGATGTGSYKFKLWAVKPRQSFAYTLGSTVSNGVPATGAGNIETPGAEDDYTFSGTAGQRIFFDGDPLGGSVCNFTRTLYSPSSAVVIATGGNCGDIGAVTLPSTGTYTLKVLAGPDLDYSGTYNFRITNVPAPQSFAYTIGSTVSNGVPASGAGNIEVPQAEDDYTFSGTAGDKIFFDGDPLGGSVCNFTRTLYQGSTVVIASGGNCADIGPVTLPTTGTYTLKVLAGANLSYTGTYSFKITTGSSVQTFAYTIGSTVSDGVPGPGAGNIETPGAEDDYTFSGTAGDRIFFDGDPLGGSVCNFTRALYSPNSAVVIASGGNCADIGPVTLPSTGTYTLKVVPPPSTTYTGTYNFRITTVPAPQTFAYTIGSTVSNGVPASGAGNIEVPQAEDDYTFSGTAGDRIFFDGDPLGGSVCNFGRTLYSPTSAVVIATGGNCADIGAVTLPSTGTYTLKVVANPNLYYTGTYNFRITTVPAPQTFAYTIGSTVSNGVPASGAGNIEVPQAEDDYTFSGTAGQRIFFDGDPLGGSVCNFGRTLYQGSTVVIATGGNCGDIGPVTLPTTGTYTLKVVANPNLYYTGTYNFRITTVPAPQSFAISIGSTVSNGVPASGAGNIEMPQAEDDYTFSGTAGQAITFDGNVLGGSVCNFTRTLYGPTSAVVIATAGNCTDAGPVTLPSTGTYTLKVVANPNLSYTGTYNFKIS